FADEKCLIAERMQVLDLGAGSNPAFRDAENMVGNERAQFQDRIKIHLKGAQVAAVDADDVAAAFQSALQFLLVVDFAEHVQVHGPGAFQQAAKCLVVEGRENQQDRVGVVGPCFQHLEVVNDKVLAQARQLGGRGSLAQVPQRPLKELLVGEHGKRGSAAAGQLDCQVGYREWIAQQAFRG